SYTNWAKLTPRHNAFVQHMLQSPLHIIGTIRAKQEYILSEKNGKQVPEKVGMKGVTREGMDYEFTLVFNLDMHNQATAIKDRTSVFVGQPESKITPETGKRILQWCNEGETVSLETANSLTERINDCKSLEELLKLYYEYPLQKKELKDAFTKRKAELKQATSAS
ncbi:AAA family ATPase, partial [Legionella pneumophila serogroup 1]